MRKEIKICVVMASFSVLLLASFTGTGEAVPIAQRVAVVTGFGLEETGFEINSAGTYVATLIDKAFPPEGFDLLMLSVNSTMEDFAQLSSPGTMQFNVDPSQIPLTAPLELMATVIWDTTITGKFDVGKYQWSIEAIPEPTSMFLLGSGLVGLAVLKAGRRKWQA